MSDADAEQSTWKAGLPRAILIGAALLLLIVFGTLSYRWVSPVPEEKSVAQQWNEAIARLGIEPVYPPQEDIAVGDVFVIITDDAKADLNKEPLAGRALKLWHVDLTEQLRQTYAEMFRFPETPDPPADGKPWKLKSSSTSVFASEPQRGDLPLVLFPGFSITSSRNAGLEPTLPGLAGSSAAPPRRRRRPRSRSRQQSLTVCPPWLPKLRSPNSAAIPC